MKNKKIKVTVNSNDMKMINRSTMIWCAISIIVVIITISIVFGNSFNIDYPISCIGGDETSYMSEVKMVINNNSWFKTNEIGAPYGTNRSAQLSYYLFNDAHVLSSLYVKITGSPFKAVNLAFFSLIVLNCIFTYWVLISRRLNPGVAAACAAVYATLPYVYMRNIYHLMLSALWTIPLAVLICLWIYEDDNFLKINKDFFKYKRNILAVIFAFLIVNSGIGYYPSFACLFFVVTALIKALEDKKASYFVKGFIQCILVSVSYFVILIPFLIAKSSSSVQSASLDRGMAYIEMFGFKIARMFIPPNGVGIESIDNLINEYRYYTTYRPESTEYLGLIGIIGFVILAIAFLRKNKEDSKTDKELSLLSKLTVVGIFFATMGGLSVFLNSLMGSFLRSTSRMIVFIGFFCIYAVGIVANELWNKSVVNNLQTVYIVPAVLIVIISLSSQKCVGTTIMNGKNFDNSETAMALQMQQRFINKLETLLPQQAMVYQLPQQEYPEGTSAGSMMTDQEFIPYLLSKDLKFSYGALRTEQSYLVNKAISEQSPADMIAAAREVGYSCILIEGRGYDAQSYQELIMQFDSLLSNKIVSEDGLWVAYIL